MTASCPFLPRSARRARAARAQRLASFARVWRRTLPLGAALIVGLLPDGTASARSLAPVRTASAGSLTPSLRSAAPGLRSAALGLRRLSPLSTAPSAPNAYYQSTATDGNYSTSGNFKDTPSGGNTVVPDGSNGTFYQVVNTTGQAITHDHSTGPSGADTIFGLNTNGSFYLTGGTLSGDSAGRSFAVSGTGSVFQISGGATLRNFVVTGTPLTVNSGSATLDNVTTNLNGTVQRTLTFANNTLATVMSGDTRHLGIYNEGTETLAGSGTLALAGGSLNVGQFDTGVIAAGITVRGAGAVQGDTTSAGLVNNGVVQANGGTVGFNSMNLTGTDETTTGALTSTGTGVVNFSTDSLTNVTTSANANVVNGRTNAFGTLTNNGAIAVGMGNTLGLGSYNEGTETLAGAGTVSLTGGSLNVGQFDNGIIAAGATVSGAGAVQGDTTSGSLVNNGTIEASDGTLTVQNLGSFASNGALVASDGSTLTSNVNVTGTGTVSALGSSTVNLAAGSALDQTGGTSQIDGTADFNGTFTVTGGTLKGGGIVNAASVVNNGGTVKPGDSPGTLTLTGTYSQASPGTLLIEFNNASHSLLAVGGTATTGGNVDFSFLDSTVGASVVGETFDFLTSAGVGTSLPSGLFFANETADPTGLSNGFVTETGPGGGVYQIARDPANANALEVVVRAVVPAPEPSQFAALGIGLLGLGGLLLRARKRHAA